MSDSVSDSVADRVVETQADVAIGIIGCGYMGGTHARSYARLAGVSVRAVYDVDPTAAQRLADELDGDVLALSRLDDLVALPGLHAVSVCTPDALHREPVEAAAGQGLHVLLEKPIATTVEDAEAIIRVTGEAGVVLAIGFVSRYLDTYQAARSALENDQLGRLASIGVHRFNTQEAGARYYRRDDVIDFLAVHDIDILHWFGGDIASVAAMADHFVFDDSPHADTVQMLVRFTSGAIGHLHVSWALPDIVPPFKGRSGVDVVGTRGTMRLDSLDDRVHVGIVGGAPYPLDWDLSRAFTDQITGFVDAVRGGAAPRTSGQDGLRALRVVLAAKRSVTGGGAAVEVDMGDAVP